MNVGTSEILSLTAVDKDAEVLATAGVHLIGKRTTEVAAVWAPYLNMAEGISFAAKKFTTTVSKQSGCD